MRKKLTLTVAGVVLSLMLVFPALGAETIKIGALYNLTGGMSSIDAPALNGAKLQAKLINEKGGLLGKKLEVIGIDTKTDQKAAATGAKKALADDVVAGIGYGDTTFVMAAAPLFQEKGVPFVTSGATHPMLPNWVGDHQTGCKKRGGMDRQFHGFHQGIVQILQTAVQRARRQPCFRRFLHDGR